MKASESVPNHLFFRGLTSSVRFHDQADAGGAGSSRSSIFASVFPVFASCGDVLTFGAVCFFSLVSWLRSQWHVGVLLLTVVMAFLIPPPNTLRSVWCTDVLAAGVLTSVGLTTAIEACRSTVAAKRLLEQSQGDSQLPPLRHVSLLAVNAVQYILACLLGLAAYGALGYVAECHPLIRLGAFFSSWLPVSALHTASYVHAVLGEEWVFHIAPFLFLVVCCSLCVLPWLMGVAYVFLLASAGEGGEPGNKRRSLYRCFFLAPVLSTVPFVIAYIAGRMWWWSGSPTANKYKEQQVGEGESDMPGSSALSPRSVSTAARVHLEVSRSNIDKEGEEREGAATSEEHSYLLATPVALGALERGVFAEKRWYLVTYALHLLCVYIALGTLFAAADTGVVTFHATSVVALVLVALHLVVLGVSWVVSYVHGNSFEECVVAFYTFVPKNEAIPLPLLFLIVGNTLESALVYVPVAFYLVVQAVVSKPLVDALRQWRSRINCRPGTILLPPRISKMTSTSAVLIEPLEEHFSSS